METDPHDINESPYQRKSPTFKILFLAFAPSAFALLLPFVWDARSLSLYLFLAVNALFSLATSYRLISFTQLQKTNFVFATIGYSLVVFVVNCFLGSLATFIRNGGHI